MKLCTTNTLTKECSSCMKNKNITDFGKNKANLDRLQPTCRECARLSSIKSLYKTRGTLDGFLKSLVKSSLRNATARGLEFNVSYKYIKNLYVKQQGLCALSNRKLTIALQYNTLNNISIDRIDNTKGYIKDNIQLVCNMVNRMKSDFNQEEFISMCKDIK